MIAGASTELQAEAQPPTAEVSRDRQLPVQPGWCSQVSSIISGHSYEECSSDEGNALSDEDNSTQGQDKAASSVS